MINLNNDNQSQASLAAPPTSLHGSPIEQAQTLINYIDSHMEPYLQHLVAQNKPKAQSCLKDVQGKQKQLKEAIASQNVTDRLINGAIQILNGAYEWIIQSLELDKQTTTTSDSEPKPEKKEKEKVFLPGLEGVKQIWRRPNPNPQKGKYTISSETYKALLKQVNIYGTPPPGGTDYNPNDKLTVAQGKHLVATSQAIIEMGTIIMQLVASGDEEAMNALNGSAFIYRVLLAEDVRCNEQHVQDMQKSLAMIPIRE
jgi:hypothetical protein